MPRSCPVCDHENLEEINAALASNERIRAIADRWSVSKTAVMRHRNEHLPASAIVEHEEAEEAEEEASNDEIIAQIRSLQQCAVATLNEAEEAEELADALRAMGEVKDDLERLAKLLNELDERSVD
jgi:hypothetical protein